MKIFPSSLKDQKNEERVNEWIYEFSAMYANKTKEKNLFLPSSVNQSHT
jgi:hypothetical protein